VLVQCSAVRGTWIQLTLVLGVLVTACTAVNPGEPVATPAADPALVVAATPVAVVRGQATIGAAPTSQTAGDTSQATPGATPATPAPPDVTPEVIRAPDVATATTLLSVQFESALTAGTSKPRWRCSSMGPK
jgi:hypothetical protein